VIIGAIFEFYSPPEIDIDKPAVAPEKSCILEIRSNSRTLLAQCYPTRPIKSNAMAKQ